MAKIDNKTENNVGQLKTTYKETKMKKKQKKGQLKGETLKKGHWTYVATTRIT